MITRNYFHTLEEWIPYLKNIKCKKYRINTYGNYWNDGSFKRFIETFDEEDEELKKSNVCNIEVHSFSDTIVIDVDYIRFYKDSKDDTIANLWGKLYWNNANADRMEELFKRCQAGLADWHGCDECKADHERLLSYMKELLEYRKYYVR